MISSANGDLGLSTIFGGSFLVSVSGADGPLGPFVMGSSSSESSGSKSCQIDFRFADLGSADALPVDMLLNTLVCPISVSGSGDEL